MQGGLSVSPSSLITSVPPGLTARGGRPADGLRRPLFWTFHQGLRPGCALSASGLPQLIAPAKRGKEETLVSNNNEVSQTTAATPAPDPVMTPEAIVEQLRILRAQIPNYVQLSIPESKSLRPVSILNPGFTQTAIDAIGSSSRVEGTVGHSA